MKTDIDGMTQLTCLEFLICGGSITVTPLINRIKWTLSIIWVSNSYLFLRVLNHFDYTFQDQKNIYLRLNNKSPYNSNVK